MTELVEHFNRQLQSDQNRALKGIEPESTTASILKDLYPLLRGPLYPKGKGRDVAGRLDECIEKGSPVNLFVVLVAQTAQAELSYLTRAVEAIKKPGVTVVTTVILADWPRIVKAPAVPSISDIESITKLIDRAGLGEIKRVSREAADTYTPDEKLRRWLLKFYERQESMADIDRVLGFQVDEDLAMRQKVGRIISKASAGGFTLGLTTELNPQLLRLYGKDIFLANINVRGEIPSI